MTEGSVDNYDIDLQEYHFTLSDKGNRNPRNFFLRELDGELRDEYLDSLSKRMKTSADGKTSKIENFKGLQALLLKLGTFEVAAAGVVKPVEEKTIQKWPSRVQSKLFTKLKDMSALDEKADEAAKND